MIQVGTVKEIWRYPVKGMGGEQLQVSHLGEQGLNGDRQWALRDSARAEIQSCKARPQLLRCSARYRTSADGHVDVLFPDGFTLGSDDPEIHRQLTRLTGQRSTLESLRPAHDIDFYRRHKRDDGVWLDELKATFTREPGEPLPDFLNDVPQSVADFVSAPGSFFLVTPLHLVTTATLGFLRTKNTGADWDARRFRPNILIETAADLIGLAEQDWVGHRLVIGPTTLDCVMTTPRCGAVTRAQAAFDADTSILRTVVCEASQNVGVYGMTVLSGEIKVGDPVQLGGL